MDYFQNLLSHINNLLNFQSKSSTYMNYYYYTYLIVVEYLNRYSLDNIDS